MISSAVVRSAAALMCAALVCLQPASASAQDAGAVEEPDPLALRLGLRLGGTWTDNTYLNATKTADLIGVGRLDLDADWMLSDSAILELFYRGDFEGHQSLERGVDLDEEHNTGHLLHLTLGVRPADPVYVTLRAGGELAYFPLGPGGQGSPYTFWGAFARAGLRLEIADTQTLEAGYTFRSDQFPYYDLDNRTHTGELAWEIALGDSAELRLPVALEYTRYAERFLLDDDGSATGSPRTGRRWIAEPRLTVRPVLDLEITAALRGAYNDSDDSYTGPYDATDPAARPETVHHYASFWEAGGFVRLRWTAAESLTAAITLSSGRRSFESRPALKRVGMELVPTSEIERDTWVRPTVSLRWRLAGRFALEASYSVLQQWSNDYLWSFTAQRVSLLLRTWWEG